MSSNKSCDTFRDELVALVYDELDAGTRESVLAHLETCTDCAARLASYRGVRNRLGDWTAEEAGAGRGAESFGTGAGQLAEEANSRSIRRRFSGLSFAAGLAAALVLVWIGRGWLMPEASTRPAGDRYVLLLRDGEYDDSNMTPEMMRDRVAEYVQWSNEWGEKGRPMSGEKLTQEAVRFGPGANEKIDPSLTLAGFFVFAADSLPQAEAVAKSCPHLKYGGAIELRKVDSIAAKVEAGG